MANILKQVVAATATVGYDLIQAEINNRSPKARRLTKLALTGSSAAGDTVVEVLVQGKSIGSYANTSTGLVADRTKDFRDVNAYVAPNELVQVFVRDAPTTNPIVLELEFTESSGRVGGYRRRSYGGGATGMRTSGMRRTTGRRSSGMY